MVKKKAKKVAKKPSKKKAKAAPDLDFVEFDIGDYQEEEDSQPYGFALSLGERIGTISQLEKIDENAIHPLIQKAGLALKLHGSLVSLVEGGTPLSPEELCSLATWLYEEASKAAEEYSIDVG